MHLVVARARGVEFFADLAQALRQVAFDGGVDVLLLGQNRELAARVQRDDLREALLEALELVARQDADLREHRRMGDRADAVPADQLHVQLVIIAHREALDDLVELVSFVPQLAHLLPPHSIGWRGIFRQRRADVKRRSAKPGHGRRAIETSRRPCYNVASRPASRPDPVAFPCPILKERRLMSKIKEVSAPVLLADIFPHTMPPHIVFDDPIHAELDGKSYVIHPADLKARDIRITDTTFRDGQQARPPYTVKQILELFDLISRLSGPRGVIRQTEFFLYSAKDQEAVQKCLDRGYRYPEITGWIRADPGDLGLVRKMGLKETGLLTSCSDYHIFMKLRLDRRKALDRYTGIVKAALARASGRAATSKTSRAPTSKGS